MHKVATPFVALSTVTLAGDLSELRFSAAEPSLLRGWNCAFGGPTMDTASVVNRLGGSRRRTKRISLTVPIQVSGEDVEKSSFTLATTASSLNRNGAALHLNRDLSVGSVLVLQNSRGTRTSARVAAQVLTGDGVYMYGVEFIDRADSLRDFWGIAFPVSFAREKRPNA